MSKITKIITAIFAIVLIATGIYFANNQKQAQAKTVKLSYLPLSASLPAWIAKEKGFFQKNGVNVEMTELANSNLNAEAVITGSSDINFYTTSTAGLLANEKSPNKFLIYTTTGNNKDINWDGLFVKTNSRINSMGELQNKKIGVFPGSSATTYLKNFLKSKQVDISKIEFVQLPPANQKTSLDSGSIDALFAYEPTTTILTKSSDYKLLQSNILYENPDAVVGIGTINKEFIKQYPDLAKRTVKSMDEALEYFKTNPKESREIISKYVKMDSTLAQEHKLANFLKSSELDNTKIQSYFDYLQSIGEIKQKVNASELIYRP